MRADDTQRTLHAATPWHERSPALHSAPSTLSDASQLTDECLQGYKTEDYKNCHLVDNIGSKIVPLEKGVVIFGANALSLLPVVLFVFYL